MPSSVILIHGAWLTSPSWRPFVEYLGNKGYACSAPPWPFDDRPVHELQADPDPGLASLGVAEIVDHYDRLIRDHSDQPLLIGHSFGGLFVQMLLDRGLGAAGVAIHPAPAKGVLPNLGIIRANLRPLTKWRGWRKTLSMPVSEFRTLFANGLAPEVVESEFEEQVVPTPGRVFFQAALAPFHDLTKIRYDNPNRAPLLLMAGSEDRIIPTSIVAATYERHAASPCRTEFDEVEGRSHYTIREPGWEEVAERCIEFFERSVN